MKSLIQLFFFVFIIIHWGCSNDSGFPVEPQLTFISVSKDTMKQSSLGIDHLFVVLEFTDGDGDIGSEDDLNLLVTDNRTGDSYDFFKIPKVPEAGANNGISGTMQLKLFNVCCQQPEEPTQVCDDVTVPTNTFTVDITLTDRAGNESNTVTSSPITLMCML